MTDTPEALPPLPEPTVYTHALEVDWALKNVGRAGSFYATPENPNDLKLFTADQMHAYARAALAQRQQVPTTAWLVEWRFNGVQWLYLWPSAPGGFSFTSDASKALRFARREDAEAALQWARDTDAARRPIGSLTRHGLALGEMLVTEHDWPALTAAPSAQEPDHDLAAAWKSGARLQYLVITGHDDDWTDYTGMTPPDLQSSRLAWRIAPGAAPSAQAELRMIECPGCGMEFADGALHNANLELHLLKALPQSKPLQSIPDSALVAARKTLEGKSGVDFLEGWVEFAAILRAALPAAQAEPVAREPKSTGRDRLQDLALEAVHWIESDECRDKAVSLCRDLREAIFAAAPAAQADREMAQRDATIARMETIIKDCAVLFDELSFAETAKVVRKELSAALSEARKT